MSRVRRFVLRLQHVFRRDRAERTLAREIAAHLALLEERFHAQGMSLREARAAARRAFGGVEQAKELQRDARSFVWLEDLRRDLGYAFRTLVRMPGFTSVAVLTLALGIGATTAIFSVVHAVLLRPLPYPGADRLVRIVEHVRATEESISAQPRTVGVLVADLPAFRAQATALSHVGVYVPSTMTLIHGAKAFRLEGARVSPSVLEMLSVPPVLGRLFMSHEERPASGAVVILGYTIWQQLFGGASDVVGRSLTLDGRSVAVVGVMPAGFQFPDRQTQLWIPYTIGGPTLRARVPPIARLAAGATLPAARAQIRSILPHLATTADLQGSPRPEFDLLGVQEQLVAPVRPALTLLAWAVASVLLIACANVANLVLSRTAVRERELALRAALGAGRARLVRQLLTESTMLALAGGLAGICLAFGGILLVRRLGAVLERRDLAVDLGIPRLGEVGIDPTVLAFTFVVAVVTGILSGLAPALRHSRTRNPALPREGAARHPMQGLLVVAEIAMAMFLLVGGGLLIRSFVKLATVDPGYDAANVLTFQVFSTPSRAPGAPPPTELRNPAAMADDIVARLQSLPTIRAAGYAEILPLVRFRSGVRLRTSPDPPPHPPGPPAPGTRLPPELPDTRIVSRDFLNVMGIRVIEGRGFGDGDVEGSPKVMLINQTLARSGFLGPNPIGTRVYAAGKALWEVVGIVEDVRQYGLDQAADPQIFIDVRQLPSSNPNVYFVVRAEDPTGLVRSIRDVVKQVSATAMVDSLATMDQLVSNSIARPRLYAMLLALFAVLAGALAVIGIYGVMAYAVARRTREIGIRIALGARRTQVIPVVLGESLVLTAAGIAAGLAGAAFLSRYLDRMLFGLDPLDPATFGAAAALFSFVAVLAAYVPARRATTVDPMVALRCE